VRRCLGVFLISLVLFPTAATAHTNLVETNPADGAVLEDLPAEATVTLGAGPQRADVVLEAPDGTVHKLRTRVADTTITADLPSTGPRGDYTLSYRVVSADGHPVTGSATFTVKAGPEPVATTPSPDETAPTATADGSASGWSSLALAGGAALVALAAGFLFWLMRR
jgi:methionine-rich copper-binding protein CopC